MKSPEQFLLDRSAAALSPALPVAQTSGTFVFSTYENDGYTIRRLGAGETAGELVAFADGGLAWSRNDPPVFEWARKSRERIPVVSTGVSTRVKFSVRLR